MVRPVTSMRPTWTPGQPPPRSRVQARGPQWTVTPPLDPVLGRSPEVVLRVISYVVRDVLFHACECLM
jgi:hypothetical protein